MLLDLKNPYKNIIKRPLTADLPSITFFLTRYRQTNAASKETSPDCRKVGGNFLPRELSIGYVDGCTVNRYGHSPKWQRLDLMDQRPYLLTVSLGAQQQTEKPSRA